MPYRFVFGSIPGAVGSAIVGAKEEQNSFARRIALQRLQIEQEAQDVAQANQVQSVSDSSWRRQLETQKLAQDQSALALKNKRDAWQMDLDQAKERRGQVETLDKLSGGPEQRRLQVDTQLQQQKLAGETELTQRKEQIGAPDKQADRLQKMVAAGWRPVTAAGTSARGAAPEETGDEGEEGQATAPAAAATAALSPIRMQVGGVTMEFAGGGKYGEWDKQQLGNLQAQIRSMETARDAELKEWEKTQSQLATLPKDSTGTVIKAFSGEAANLQRRMQEMKTPEQWSAAIGAMQTEKQRIIDKNLPPSERQVQQDQRAAAETSGKLATLKQKSLFLTAPAQQALAWAEAKLTGGTVAEQAKARAILDKLYGDAGLN